MFASIASQSNIIKNKLPKSAWKLKNTIDQSKFNNNCTPNIKIANLTSSLCKPSCHTRYNAIPIKIYNVVHTGPNNQFGGDHVGFDSAAYHVGISVIVAMDPINPTINGINIEAIILGYSLNVELTIFFLLNL